MEVFFKKRKKLNKVLIGVFSLLIFILLLNVFQGEVKNFFFLMSASFQKFFWQKGNNISDSFDSFIKMKSLKKEVDELKSKNQGLLAEIATLRELKKENKILREALEIGLQKDFKLLSAQVIGKDVPQDFLLIDRGVEDEVSENMPVITQQKVLLGKISEVYKNFSKVMLISNKKSTFDAEIQGKDISGIVKGEGNFKIILDLIPRDEEVSQGDIIISSSLGGIFPPGILVGQIERAEKNDIEPFQEIEIIPAFDITEINTLFLITSSR